MSEKCPVCQATVRPSDACCPQCGFKLMGATQKFEPLSVDEAQRVCQRVEPDCTIVR